jgi:hypothetical protein
MSYGYHEVKLFLASEMYDAARHYEVFRKRALSNGGGLGIELRGDVKRMILESRGGWSETALLLYVLRGIFTLTIYRYGEMFAHNTAEQTIFAGAIQDKARHLSYGFEHLRYAVVHQEDKALANTQKVLEYESFILLMNHSIPEMLKTIRQMPSLVLYRAGKDRLFGRVVGEHFTISVNR